MKNTLFYIILLLIPLWLSGQPVTPESTVKTIQPEVVPFFEPGAYKGQVDIHQTYVLKKLVGVQMAIYKKQKGFHGYRLRIFADVGVGARDNARKLKAEFMQKYPDIPNYMIYNSPNFELHVGDYRSRFEAEKLRNELKEDYQAAFIVSEIVKFPELQRYESDTDSP